MRYDLIVVGMGLVGSSLIAALQSTGLSILVLEEKPLDLKLPADLNSRPISLSYASYQALLALGVWPKLQESSAPILKVHVSTQGGFGRLQFSAQEQNLPALGYVVPFSVLQRQLYQQAQMNAQMELLKVQEILAIETGEQAVKIKVKTETDERELTASLIVGADGNHSKVRELLNIAVEQHCYQEVALAARIKFSQPHDGVAYERFSEHGTVAILPLQNSHQAAMVWTMPQAQWQEYQLYNEALIKEKIQQVMGYRLGKIQEVEISGHHPVSMQLASEQIRAGVVLIGNAAHNIYPLAAQGFNLGLRDAAVLAELIADAVNQNQSLGSLKLLEHYQSQRSQDQRAVVKLVAALYDSFNLKIPGINPLRAAALLSVDLLPAVKHSLARRFLGMAGKVSKLLRGIHLNE